VLQKSLLGTVPCRQIITGRWHSWLAYILNTYTILRDANSEHELEESTADVDRFVDGGAVVRMKIGGGDEGGSDVDGGGNREGTAAAQEGGAGVDGAVGAVSRFHEDHLRGVLEQVRTLFV